MRNKSQDNWDNCRNRPGIVLLVTLVLLVVLSILGYTLSSRVAAWRHRNQYIIDYQAARYGCDSAVKYTLAMLEDVNTPLVARPNEPDFSDLFTLTEQDYEEFLAQQPAEKTFDRDQRFSDIDDINDVNYNSDVNDFNTPDSSTIRGPYGPPWPFVTKPDEFKIGSVKVRIEVEDENAKYPLGWALLSQKNIQREALAGLETFCEWMDVEEEQVDSLKSQLKEISKIKPFKLDFKPIKTIEKKTTEEKKTTKARSRRGRRRRSRRRRRRPTRKTIPVTVQIARQTADFAKLFHSSLIDTEALARPTIISETRQESALKYMGRWGSRKVNINTAPRHVLEAAFVFGGDAKEIAEEIIQRRRIEPFKDIKDLKQALFSYSDSIEKCEKYITMASRLFTIRVTAVSGVAKASAIVVITKDGKKLERIATISS